MYISTFVFLNRVHPSVMAKRHLSRVTGGARTPEEKYLSTCACRVGGHDPSSQQARGAFVRPGMQPVSVSSCRQHPRGAPDVARGPPPPDRPAASYPWVCITPKSTPPPDRTARKKKKKKKKKKKLSIHPPTCPVWGVFFLLFSAEISMMYSAVDT